MTLGALSTCLSILRPKHPTCIIVLQGNNTRKSVQSYQSNQWQPVEPALISYVFPAGQWQPSFNPILMLGLKLASILLYYSSGTKVHLNMLEFFAAFKLPVIPRIKCFVLSPSQKPTCTFGTLLTLCKPAATRPKKMIYHSITLCPVCKAKALVSHLQITLIKHCIHSCRLSCDKDNSNHKWHQVSLLPMPLHVTGIPNTSAEIGAPKVHIAPYFVSHTETRFIIITTF